MRKRGLPVIAATLLVPVISTTVCAGGVSLSETLITKGSYTAVRRTADPGALTGIPTTGGAGAVVIDGTVDGTSFRIKSDYGIDRGGVDGTTFSAVTRRTSLLRLSAAGDFLGGRWTIGKYNESFDDGFYAHVLDFLTDNIASTDFFDYSYRSNGFPALRYLYGRLPCVKRSLEVLVWRFNCGLISGLFVRFGCNSAAGLDGHSRGRIPSHHRALREACPSSASDFPTHGLAACHHLVNFSRTLVLASAIVCWLFTLRGSRIQAATGALAFQLAS
ncbi:uncharacterized protein E1O_26000 [Burkholderiales bacterium GJ-E10]|nr:uncharacterized protein E1O_26000 [Burkholderiales bacterium GJ-E10]